MHRSLALVAFLVGLAAATSAQAGSLLQATFHIRVGILPAATFTSTGPLLGSASGTGAGAFWSVGAGDVPGGTTTLTIPTSAAPPIEDIVISINSNPLSGSFAASSNASMAVTGLARITAYGGLTLLGVPLVVGSPTVITPPVVSGIGITGYGNAWTTKTTTIATLTPGGGALTRMGSNGLVNGGGTVVLVSALNVLTSTAGQLPSFAVLTLTYAPDVVAEPVTLALVGVGAACAWVGRRRLARRAA